MKGKDVENKKNKKLFNIIMAAVILLIIGAGVLAVGMVKGRLGGEAGDGAAAKDLKGIVSVERGGASFELKKGDGLKAGDRITVNEKASVTIGYGDNTWELAENSSVVLAGIEDERLSVELTAGELFAIINEGDRFGNITAQGNRAEAEGAVFSVNTQTGSMGVNVFEGEVSVSNGQDSQTAKAGESICIVGKEMETGELKLSSLNEFNINKAIEASRERKLCFSEEELKKVLKDREAEALEAEKEADNSEENDGGKGQQGQSGSGGGDGSSGSSSGKGDKDDAGGKEEDKNDAQQGTSQEDSNSQGKPEYDYSCIIEIRCDTILDNMGDLTPGKEGYVPADGVILGKTKVGFNDGETVYDVLQRVCREKGIQLEASWSPAYGSSYVEGINHLYEFDCGPLSGWMYKVNGWFPNYGGSAYKLKDGDAVSWLYTCEGLGHDIGGNVF